MLLGIPLPTFFDTIALGTGCDTRGSLCGRSAGVLRAVEVMYLEAAIG